MYLVSNVTSIDTLTYKDMSIGSQKGRLKTVPIRDANMPERFVSIRPHDPIDFKIGLI